MTNTEKITQLRTLLCSSLLPLIDNSYVLLDIPYYSNPGDTLIWEGTEHLLKKSSYRCLQKTSEECFDFPEFSKDTVILLQGGGNWGDLWRRHQEFRLKVIEKYKYNKIIILPQSVYYENLKNWEFDAAILKQHNMLHICARDVSSYNLIRDAGLNNVYLLPDMAFCINPDYLHQFEEPSIGRKIYVKREDSEKPNYNELGISIKDELLDISDWPTMMAYDSVQLFFYRIYNHRKYGLQTTTDLYADKILRKHIIKNAVKFVSKYDYIFTTRLHVAILSVLLGKPFTLIDNSYGKNSNLYNAWLSDLDSIILQS